MNPLLKTINTIFIGTPTFAVPILQSLVKVDFLSLNTIITQLDKKVGRKKIITPPPIKIAAEKLNLPVLQFENIKDIESIEQIKKLKPDLIIVAAYGQILPKEIIEMPKYGCVNVHASLLPKYRGASPIQTAILNGEQETGVTIMKMDIGLDDGDIVSRDKIEISNNDTAQTLHDKLSRLGANLLIKTLPDYLSGKIKPVPQDANKATFTKILSRADGKIDFSKSAVEIERMLRAFTPWPGVYAFFKEKKLKILNAKISKQINPDFSVGEFYVVNGELIVNCCDGVLVLKKVQLEGKNVMSGEEFVNGYLR